MPLLQRCCSHLVNSLRSSPAAGVVPASMGACATVLHERTSPHLFPWHAAVPSCAASPICVMRSDDCSLEACFPVRLSLAERQPSLHSSMQHARLPGISKACSVIAPRECHLVRWLQGCPHSAPGVASTSVHKSALACQTARSCSPTASLRSTSWRPW